MAKDNSGQSALTLPSNSIHYKACTLSQARRYLMFAELDYAFEILRPLANAAKAKGHSVRWFLNGATTSLLKEDEQQLFSVSEVKSYSPDAVFVPGNEVPLNFPGLKVQVFHGFGIEKKGHFRIRGMFDLYCTFGPLTTLPFRHLADQHGWFRVAETGWPKMDPLFTLAAKNFETKNAPPCILYAPTFSPALTSAPAISKIIQELVEKKADWNWVVKFHPKMAQEYAAPLQSITANNFKISTDSSILPLLVGADVMVTDTSSVAAEFMLLDKPVIALRNRQPGPHLINIENAEELPVALDNALRNDPSTNARRDYVQQMHPYTDGRSSERVLDAVETMLIDGRDGLRRKPFSPLRRLKYWRSLPS